MKNNLKRAAVPAASFLIPGLVMLWAFAAVGMAPFGDKTILISDMSTQYVEFFCALKNGDLFFSWSKALGTGYIGVFSYYVSSPLSLLTLLVPNEAMPVGLLFLAALKIALAGLSFALFARKRFPVPGTAVVFGAVCYALMSYNAVYAICIMWLDGVIWLPLILLALERILAGRGAGPFVAALTACFISTWYISYMVGIFCALYLCARLFVLRPGKGALLKILERFFGGAACALALTAWLWLPTFLAMFNGKFSGGSMGYDGLLACTPLDILGQLRMGQYRSISYGAAPYIFCGTAALVLAAAYFFFRRFPLREKISNGAMLAVLGLSMLLSPLDKAWHLFQRPNWFPFRYSFVVSFALVYLAVQALPQMLKKLKGRAGARGAQGVAAALVCLTVLELLVNTTSILMDLEKQFGSVSYRAYREYYAANGALTEIARKDSGEGFFRMGAAEDRGHNSPLSFGYPGITHYSSLYNYDVNHLTRELGFAQSWMWCAYYGSTPVTDALLGVKYVVSKDDMPTGYEPIARVGKLKLWKNPNTLPLAYFVEAGSGAMTRENPFQRQNGLLSELTGEETAAFVPADVSIDVRDGETVFTLTGTGKPLYMDLSASGLREVLMNGRRVAELGSTEAASVHYIGTPGLGKSCAITVRGPSGWTGQVWQLNQDILRSALERANRGVVTSVSDNGRVRLTAQTDRARTLAVTIPAENGWTAYVDGQPAETGVWLDAFLLLDIPAGAHEVELRYTPPGLVPGAALGALAAVGLALAYAKRNYCRYKNKRGEKNVP